MSDDILETLQCGVLRYNEETQNYETLITKRERLAIKEITRLRGEVERLTLERDYWARARNEWEKSARLLEEENKRLTRELAYMTVQRDQWRSTCASHASRAEAAKKARDMATSALRFYANAEVYKPDAIGRVGDLTFAARDALASIARIAAATGETNE